MKVLGIITARGGSKGIPGKNLKLLAGKSLLAYTIETARRSGALDRVILSTEDEAIAAAGRDLGC
ncbi:MAG TPA: acylneuraminate cytidylyltransferase family protein, partial [Vicinamibacterales bacterium]|nr:acylneuraminate cytidylyltransferase family protein [Vicinamibacterales bacterium]